MPEILILTETDLRHGLELDLELIDSIEEAFASLASGGVTMPPVLRLDIPQYRGEVDVKTAYMPALPSFAIKVSPGFFDNPKIGLPSVNGLMILFSARTGLVEALLLDNGYLTDLRTAAAGAVAARRLARRDARRVGIIGAGVQAGLQLEALTLVRPVAEAVVWARDPGKAAGFAREMSRRLGLEVEVAADREALVRRSDIVVTATPSSSPLVEAAWLHPGLHITAMGSDAEHKQELASDVVAAADVYVPDRQSQCAHLGELRHPLATGLVPPESVFPELGRIVNGDAPGRRHDDEVTIADLTGTGAQDTAVAVMARTRAELGGLGRRIES